MAQVSLRRAGSWGKRRLRGLPVFRDLARVQYRHRLRAHAGSIRPLHPDDAPLLETLERDGVCILPVRELGWEGTEGMLADLDRLTDELAAAPRGTGNRIPVRWRRLCEAPAARDWGLGARALALAHNYIRLPLFYGGTQIRCELKNGAAGGVRNWHLDVEDRRILKLIVYARDVEAGGGPFEYLPLAETGRAVGRLGYSVGLVTDADLAAAGVSAEASAAVTGPKFTAVLADVGRLLHRAQPPVTRDRYTATYCWMSIHGDRDHHKRGRPVDA